MGGGVGGGVGGGGVRLRSVVLGEKLPGEEHALPLFVPENGGDGGEEGGVLRSGGTRGEEEGVGVESEWSRSGRGMGDKGGGMGPPMLAGVLPFALQHYTASTTTIPHGTEHHGTQRWFLRVRPGRLSPPSFPFLSLVSLSLSLSAAVSPELETAVLSLF